MSNRVCKYDILKDALTLCYKARDVEMYQVLANLGKDETIDFKAFVLNRIEESYECNFVVSLEWNDEPICAIYFNQYEKFEEDAAQRVYIRAFNQSLYNGNYKYIEIIASDLGFEYNNITYLEVAQDTNHNVCRLFKHLRHSNDYTTVFNLRDFDKKTENPYIRYENSGSDERPNLYQSIYAFQPQCVKDNNYKNWNKKKGVTLCIYDKKKEAEFRQKKYILDYYSNPTSLYRTEIRLNHAQIKAYMVAKNHFLNPFNMSIGEMEDLFYYFLYNLIHFKQKRKQVRWKTDILHKPDATPVNNKTM